MTSTVTVTYTDDSTDSAEVQKTARDVYDHLVSASDCHVTQLDVTYGDGTTGSLLPNAVDELRDAVAALTAITAGLDDKGTLTADTKTALDKANADLEAKLAAVDALVSTSAPAQTTTTDTTTPGTDLTPVTPPVTDTPDNGTPVGYPDSTVPAEPATAATDNNAGATSDTGHVNQLSDGVAVAGS